MFFSLAIVVGLIALEGFLFTKIRDHAEAKGLQTAAVQEIQQNPELAENGEAATKVAVDSPVVSILIGLAVVNGLAILVIVAFVLVPDIGEFMGSQVYAPDREEKKENPYAPALSAVAQGNYEDAVDLYMAMARENPDDIHAVCEAAKLTATKLENPDGGIAILENYLELDHEPETAAQLAFYLADLAIREKQDYDYASVVYKQVIASMPATPQALKAAQEIKRIESHLSPEAAEAVNQA
jgi:hypothetical protein